MFCQHCGNELNKDAKFCPVCGKPVTEESIGSNNSNNNTQAPGNAVAAAPAAPAASVSQATPVPPTTPATPVPPVKPAVQSVPATGMPIENGVVQKKKSPLFLILGIVGIVVIAALVTAIVLITKASKETESTATYSEMVDNAKKLFGEGKNGEAVSEYEKAMDLNPKEYAAYVGLFDIYVSENNYTAAGIVLDNGLNSVDSTSGKIQLETCRSKLTEMSEKKDDGSKTIEDENYLENDTNGNKNEITGTEPESTPGVKEPETTPEEKEPEATPAVKEPEKVVKSNVLMNIRQIDNSNYPEITVYTDITDINGNNVENIKKSDIVADEIDAKGKIHHVSLKDVIKIIGEENISINLVIDKSGSMSDYNSMQQVKNAVHALIDYMDLEQGDCMEIVSFDDYVYLNQEFTTDKYKLMNAVDSLYPGGMTSLYDAIYSALYQTYYAEGAKCVVAFTDGLENNSNYTYNDVASLAKSTGIPVYIVGVGGEYDAYTYTQLAAECGGAYYSASRNDIENVLSDIYISLYTEQRDYYVLRYDTANKKNTKNEWTLNLSMSDTSDYEGECSKVFLAKADLSGAFSDKYFNVDYILPFSGTREVTEADLRGLSLAQLRIARNEIFARHGRQFKDALLNQWFYSKSWYLRITYKYAPDYFDKYNPDPLSKVENKNADFIKKYEEKLMASQDIFPNANIIELSNYDLALTKSVLKQALTQMKKYPDSQILKDNIKKVQDAINTESIKY